MAVMTKRDVEADSCPSLHTDHGEAAGSQKKESPDRYKTKMCNNFIQRGWCPYETRCDFAHGEEDLHTVEQNRQMGLTTREAIKQHQRQLAMEQRQQLMAMSSGPIPDYDTACRFSPYPAVVDHSRPCVDTFHILCYANNPYNCDLLELDDHVEVMMEEAAALVSPTMSDAAAVKFVSFTGSEEHFVPAP